MKLHASGEDYLEAVLVLQKEKGMVRSVAEQTYEKHCFFTRLLVEAGVDPKTAEQDACRMEHVISPESFQKLAELYQKAHPNTDPTGDGRQFHAKTDPAD